MKRWNVFNTIIFFFLVSLFFFSFFICSSLILLLVCLLSPIYLLHHMSSSPPSARLLPPSSSTTRSVLTALGYCRHDPPCPTPPLPWIYPSSLLPVSRHHHPAPRQPCPCQRKSEREPHWANEIEREPGKATIFRSHSPLSSQWDSWGFYKKEWSGGIWLLHMLSVSWSATNGELVDFRYMWDALELADSQRHVRYFRCMLAFYLWMYVSICGVLYHLTSRNKIICGLDCALKFKVQFFRTLT